MSDIDTKLATVCEETQVSTDARQRLAGAFQPHFQEFETAAENAKQIKDDPKAAKASRLELKRIRCAAEKTRKGLKEDALRYGKAVDGINHVLLYALKPIEERMEEIETAEARRIAAERDAMIADRCNQVIDMAGNPALYNLGEMTDEEFGDLLGVLHAAKLAREEEERRQEDARRQAEEQARAAAEQAELERQRRMAEMEAENERLRKEREAAAAQAEKERKAAEKAAAIERQKREKAEREAIRIRAEHAERERIDEERIAAEAEEERQAELAPDREKLEALADTVSSFAIPDIANKAVQEQIADQFAKMARWIRASSEKL